MRKMTSRTFEKGWRLQLFTEGGATGTGGSGNGGDAKGKQNNDPGKGDGKKEELSFDDFLGLEGNQAEFDRRVQKAIDTAVSNAQKKWRTITDDKVSEAEKLAQMTSEEREKYRADKAEQELANLKKQMALGDMVSTARGLLSDEKISVPDDIIKNLVSDDAEKTKAAVEGFTKAFKDAVQDAVKEALKGNPPKKGTGGDSNVTKEQIYAIKDPAERQKMIAEHMDLFQ